MTVVEGGAHFELFIHSSADLLNLGALVPFMILGQANKIYLFLRHCS